MTFPLVLLIIEIPPTDKNRHPFSGAFLRGREGTRAARAEGEGKRGRKQIARRSCEGEARCLAEGAPQGFRQIPTVSPKARIRAHLALFLPDSAFGHLRLSKLPHPHI